MAQKTASVATPARRSRWLAGCGGLVVALVLVALAIVHQQLCSRGAAELAKNAPAQRWELGVGYAAPIWWLLGQSCTVSAHGVQVKMDKNVMVTDVTAEAEVAVDISGGKVKFAAPATIVALLDAKAFADSVRAMTHTGGLADELQVSLAENKVKASLKRKVMGFPISATVVGRPRVQPPATLIFDFDQPAVDSPLAALKDEAESLLKQGLLRDFRFDLSQGGKYPVKLTSAVVRDERLELQLSADLQQAVHGQPAPAGSPAKP